MAIELADSLDIPLVLANDPDADRFCAAERGNGATWHIFTGNELGIVLAYSTFTAYQRQSGDLRTSFCPIGNGRSLAHVILRRFF